MKNLIFITLILSVILSVNAQDDKKGLEFHSISFSLNGHLAEVLDPYYEDSNSRSSGIGLNFDIAMNKGLHIFKLYASRGGEADILGGDYFSEYNLMYGRELNIKEWLGIDFFAGIGSFTYYSSYSFPTKNKKGVIGFPLQSKIRFNTGRIFSLGIQLHSNINSATMLYQSGIFLQWKL